MPILQERYSVYSLNAWERSNFLKTLLWYSRWGNFSLGACLGSFLLWPHKLIKNHAVLGYFLLYVKSLTSLENYYFELCFSPIVNFKKLRLLNILTLGRISFSCLYSSHKTKTTDWKKRYGPESQCSKVSWHISIIIPLICLFYLFDF
jgi:hypothetical protein